MSLYRTCVKWIGFGVFRQPPGLVFVVLRFWVFELLGLFGLETQLCAWNINNSFFSADAPNDISKSDYCPYVDLSEHSRK